MFGGEAAVLAGEWEWAGCCGPVNSGMAAVWPELDFSSLMLGELVVQRPVHMPG